MVDVGKLVLNVLVPVQVLEPDNVGSPDVIVEIADETKAVVAKRVLLDPATSVGAVIYTCESILETPIDN